MVSSSVSAFAPTSQSCAPERGPVGSGAAGPLDNYAGFVTPPLRPGAAEGLSRRYRRRSILWRESSLPRVRKCGRVRRGNVVGVRSGPTGAGFSGLVTCGSPWACPVCNAKIMAVRRLEIGAAVTEWMSRGGAVLFVTRTLRHHRGNRLSDLWDVLSGAWQSLQNGSPWSRWRERLGLHGALRVIETTTGDNGWHVHVHALLFVAGTVSDDVAQSFAAWSADRWGVLVQRRGLPAPLAIGQDVRVVREVTDASLAEYFTKLDQGGRSPADAMGFEMTSTQSKLARGSHKTVPVWDLLSRLEQGDADALDLWHEWERASKGRHPLRWSPGLRRDLLGVVPERQDEDIAAEVVGDEDLLWITAEGWSTCVAAPAIIPKILIAAYQSPELLRELLNAHLIDYLDPGSPSCPPSTTTSAPPAGRPTLRRDRSVTTGSAPAKRPASTTWTTKRPQPRWTPTPSTTGTPGPARS